MCVCVFIASTCNHGDIRLYGGYVSWEGFPEVCINGQWAKACQSNWNDIDSSTFCRQLLNRQDNISKYSGKIVISTYINKVNVHAANSWSRQFN